MGLKEEFKKHYERVNGQCENCGKFITTPRADNFAHFKSKNLSTESEKLTDFAFVCHQLHHYQHTRATNLRYTDCVMRFLNQHGRGLNGRDPKPFFGEFRKWLNR